ncbi:MAG TPA: hypothetical protein VGH28_16450 [Polyangiaceae bacterium]|jgi:hypothetical protein
MRSAAFALLLCACGGGSPATSDAGPPDAKPDVHHPKLLDASVADEPDDGDGGTGWDRMSPHGGIVIDSIKLHAIYVLAPGDPLEDRDELLAWIVSSPDYWSLLAQYGVGPGALVGSTTLDVSEFFRAGDVYNDKVGARTVGDRVQDFAATLPPDDGGVPNAYIVFLPKAADSDFGDGDCGYALGYHDYATSLPYAVVRWCGNSGTTISHELAEMATDPVPFGGWYSDADEYPAGGEIGDLCNFWTNIDGHVLTELWSNADGLCGPP